MTKIKKYKTLGVLLSPGYAIAPFGHVDRDS